jgi:hypothetical protein
MNFPKEIPKINAIKIYIDFLIDSNKDITQDDLKTILNIITQEGDNVMVDSFLHRT